LRTLTLHSGGNVMVVEPVGRTPCIFFGGPNQKKKKMGNFAKEIIKHPHADL
jgi:hypothetical protein